MKKLPLGIQSIRKVLSGKNYVYVDKTTFIKKLLDEGSPYFFMSRPRRFGKSLFLSTLEQVFKGNKDLFKGLGIYRIEYEWKKYPVLRFDLSQIASHTTEEFCESMKRTLIESANAHGISIETSTVKEGLKSLVVQLFSANKNNNKVVVLVDEYDHGIISRLNNLEVAQGNREILKDFFTMLKSLDEYLKFIFITGISRFSQVSLFSGLNNLKDITMDPRYAGMMGYTDEELKTNFQDHICAIVNERNLQGGLVTEEDIIDEVRNWYNGYRFSKSDVCVYNPFSTLNFMDKKETGGYWYNTGTPSFLIDQLKNHSKSVVSLDGTTAREDELMDISSLEDIDLGLFAQPLVMYQSRF